MLCLFKMPRAACAARLFSSFSQSCPFLWWCCCRSRRLFLIPLTLPNRKIWFYQTKWCRITTMKDLERWHFEVSTVVNRWCRDGVVVRALASNQCGPGSIPRVGVICGLNLLVLYSAPRSFSPGTPVFRSPPKPIFDLIWITLLLSVYSVCNWISSTRTTRKPIGSLEAPPRDWTRDYQDQL